MQPHAQFEVFVQTFVKTHIQELVDNQLGELD